MKKTIKSLMIALALTAVANGQRSLTLDDINKLYRNALSNSAEKVLSEVSELKTNYANALKIYREDLFDVRSLESVATIAAIDKEIANWMEHRGNLEPLVAGADAKMKAFRATYNSQLEAIVKSSQKDSETLRKVLVAQLEALQKRLVKDGDMRGALAVHDRLEKLGAVVAKEATDSSDPLEKKSMVITKEFGGYASAVSKQKLRLEQGAEYTLTFLTKLGDKELNEHDCLPRFYREEGEPDFRGGDKNKMRIAQRLSEKVKVSNSHDGWDKVTVKFTHAYDEPVVLGVVFYDTEDMEISLRDFTLTDSEGKNLITKNLNAVSGWVEGEFNTFTK